MLERIWALSSRTCIKLLKYIKVKNKSVRRLKVFMNYGTSLYKLSVEHRSKLKLFTSGIM